MAIKLSPETTRQLQASITRYVAENLDQDIGDLKAGLFLDYCLKEIGPIVYNQAIADAQSYFQGHDATWTAFASSPSSRTGRPRIAGASQGLLVSTTVYHEDTMITKWEVCRLRADIHVTKHNRVATSAVAGG